MLSPLIKSVTDSVDAPAALAAVLPKLFHGIHALGSSPRRIVGALGRAGVGRKARVVDLACGKGAVAVQIARAASCTVVGIDACEPFVCSARDLAICHNVDRLCTFKTASIERFVRRPGPLFDAALMIGLWHTDRAAPILRRLTRPGGVYVIDDAVALHKNVGATLSEVRGKIESLGDKILEARYMPRAAVRRLNFRLYRELETNARRLARERPDLRPALRTFLRRQREANVILDEVLRPVLVAVRRTNG